MKDIFRGVLTCPSRCLGSSLIKAISLEDQISAFHATRLVSKGLGRDVTTVGLTGSRRGQNCFGFLLDITPISETYEFVLGFAICMLPSICDGEVVCDPFWYNVQVGVGNKDDYVVEMELHLEEDAMRVLFRGYFEA